MGYFVIKQSSRKDRQTILKKLSLYPSVTPSQKYLTRYNKYNSEKQTARLFEDKREAELFARKYKGLVIQEHQQSWRHSLPVQILLMLALFAGGGFLFVLALTSPAQERFSIGRYYILGVALFVGGISMLRNLMKRVLSDNR